MATFSQNPIVNIHILNHTRSTNVSYDFGFIPIGVGAWGMKGVTTPNNQTTLTTTALGVTFEQGCYPCLNILGANVDVRFWSGGLNQYINILPHNGFHITQDRELFDSAENGNYRVTVDAGGSDNNMGNIFFQIYDR